SCVAATRSKSWPSWPVSPRINSGSDDDIVLYHVARRERGTGAEGDLVRRQDDDRDRARDDLRDRRNQPHCVLIRRLLDRYGDLGTRSRLGIAPEEQELVPGLHLAVREPHAGPAL